MRTVLFFVMAVVGLAMAWPEGQPNCPVAGNWSDPERVDLVTITEKESDGNKIQQVTFITGGVVFNGTGSLEDSRSAVIRATAGNETLILNIICQNNMLWIMQTPITNSNRMIRVLTLSRLPQPATQLSQHQATTQPAEDTPNPSPPKYYLLVNITIPKTYEDDATLDGGVVAKNYYEEKLSNEEGELNGFQRLDDDECDSFNKDCSCPRDNDECAGSNSSSCCRNKGCFCRAGHGNQCSSCSYVNNVNNCMTVKNVSHTQPPSNTMFPTDNPGRSTESSCVGSSPCNACLSCSQSHHEHSDKGCCRSKGCVCTSCGNDDCPGLSRVNANDDTKKYNYSVQSKDSRAATDTHQQTTDAAPHYTDTDS